MYIRIYIYIYIWSVQDLLQVTINMVYTDLQSVYGVSSHPPWILMIRKPLPNHMVFIGKRFQSLFYISFWMLYKHLWTCLNHIHRMCVCVRVVCACGCIICNHSDVKIKKNQLSEPLDMWGDSPRWSQIPALKLVPPPYSCQILQEYGRLHKWGYPQSSS